MSVAQENKKKSTSAGGKMKEDFLIAIGTDSLTSAEILQKTGGAYTARQISNNMHQYVVSGDIQRRLDDLLRMTVYSLTEKGLSFARERFKAKGCAGAFGGLVQNEIADEAEKPTEDDKTLSEKTVTDFKGGNVCSVFPFVHTSDITAIKRENEQLKAEIADLTNTLNTRAMPGNQAKANSSRYETAVVDAIKRENEQLKADLKSARNNTADAELAKTATRDAEQLKVDIELIRAARHNADSLLSDARSENEKARLDLNLAVEEKAHVETKVKAAESIIARLKNEIRELSLQSAPDTCVFKKDRKFMVKSLSPSVAPVNFATLDNAIKAASSSVVLHGRAVEIFEVTKIGRVEKTIAAVWVPSK